MTNNEREEEIKWFESRAKVATMPGAKKMFRLAIDALREMDRLDNRRIDMDYKELTVLAEKAINDIYRVRPCSICACFNNSECDVRCVKCFEDDNHYHKDFKWRGEKEVGYHDAK